jgi:hypothetical protein
MFDGLVITPPPGKSVDNETVVDNYAVHGRRSIG